MTQGLDLDTRSGLPDALRVLVEAYPRTGWSRHENFTGTVRFWLDRHLMFRDLVQRLQTETRGFLDGDRDAQQIRRHLARMGGMFLNELHMHHHVEDSHYFPQLIGLDTRLAAGFDLLEADHQAIDGRLHRFADRANAVFHAEPATLQDAMGAFETSLAEFEGLLDRHLTDEEELVVPVILASGFDG